MATEEFPKSATAPNGRNAGAIFRSFDFLFFDAVDETLRPRPGGKRGGPKSLTPLEAWFDVNKMARSSPDRRFRILYRDRAIAWDWREDRVQYYFYRLEKLHAIHPLERYGTTGATYMLASDDPTELAETSSVAFAAYLLPKNISSRSSKAKHQRTYGRPKPT